MMVVKNSLARRATEGTRAGRRLRGIEGTLAVVWGDMDIVALAKEIVRLQAAKEYAAVRSPRGAIDGGRRLSADQVVAVSKWPTRQEQLSLLMGQILVAGGHARQPVDERRRGAGQPDQATCRRGEEAAAAPDGSDAAAAAAGSRAARAPNGARRCRVHRPAAGLVDANGSRRRSETEFRQPNQPVII